VLASGRFELAIIIPKERNESLSVVSLAGIVSLAFCTVSFVVFWLYGDLISAWLNNPKLKDWILFVPLFLAPDVLLSNLLLLV
jgi:hypothetical protein